MQEIFLTYMPRHFPLGDVEDIRSRLEKSGALIPGFIAAPVGLLDVRAITYAQSMEGKTFVLLPDRNVVSRMAQVARHGAPTRRDKPSQLACDLMAYCQAMNVLIEPSIAFHELAHCDGNSAALFELGWFRAADRGAADAWIALAQGRAAKVNLGEPETPPDQDLAYPLNRWRRNYIAALKLAELELSDRPVLTKGLEFLRWMFEEFIIAGPAAICGLYYLGPRMARRSLMKRLRSSNRDAALAGIRNAAWDMTHLSEFVRRVGEAKMHDQQRFIFATADEDLAAMAPALFSGLEDADVPSLSSLLSYEWPHEAAKELQQALRRYVENNTSPHRPRPNDSRTFLGDSISAGEAKILDWRP